MKKLLKPVDLLLLGLAGLVDVFEEARDPLGMQASYCQNIYGWVPERFKRHNFFRVVQRQLKSGNIETTVNDKKVYLRLTPAGQEKIIRDFPILKLQNSRWDGKWRMVFFDISETSRRVRNILRSKLKELGLGMLQQSVWITPHDITKIFTEFLRASGLENQVYVIETSRLLMGDEKLLAEKIWHLNKLNEEYKDLLAEIKAVKSMYIATDGRRHVCTLSNKQSMAIKMKIAKLKRKYMELLTRDPFLPKELLPNSWVGEEMKKEIGKI